jgi:hypothetical protein
VGGEGTESTYSGSKKEFRRADKGQKLYYNLFCEEVVSSFWIGLYPVVANQPDYSQLTASV